MTTLTSKPIVGQTWIWADEFNTEVILLTHFDVDQENCYFAYGILLSSLEDNRYVGKTVCADYIDQFNITRGWSLVS